MQKPRFPFSWLHRAAPLAAAALAVYGALLAESAARGREAFRRAELHDRWRRDPDEKRRYFEREFLRGKERLDRGLAEGRLSEPEHRLDVDLLRLHRDGAVGESSAKRAFQGYQDVYELFSRPETRWTRRARLLAPAAKQRWREELQSKGVPFQEYMLEPEAGEEEGFLVVYSTRDRKEASLCLAALEGRDLPVRLFDGPAQGRPAHEGYKILAPRDMFWRAHDAVSSLAAQ